MVTFVILHYNDYIITQQAIDTIKRGNDREQYHIIVVDNGSPNNSGTFLKNRFDGDEHVTVLLVGENLGFAKGNNVGYSYAKTQLKSDVIVVMNNDVMVEQDGFVAKLEQNKQLIEYEIIMPDIINKDGYHQNPFRDKPLSDKELILNFFRIGLLKLIYNTPLINNIWINRNKTITNKRDDLQKIYANKAMMVPHGACIIYTKLWIENEDYAFIPDTFLYGEEDILFEYVINKNYQTFYDNSLWVRHLEDVATNSVVSDDLSKAKFLFNNSFVSQKVLIKIRKFNKESKIFIIQG